MGKKDGNWQSYIYENKMVIDVNLYLKNENEEIHHPVTLRTLELTVNKIKSIEVVRRNLVRVKTPRWLWYW